MIDVWSILVRKLRLTELSDLLEGAKLQSGRTRLQASLHVTRLFLLHPMVQQAKTLPAVPHGLGLNTQLRFFPLMLLSLILVLAEASGC